MINKNELEAYYRIHSNTETANYFNISKTTLVRLINSYGIAKKAANNHRTPVQTFLTGFYSHFNKQTFTNDFKVYTQRQLAEKYNLSIRQISYLKADLQLEDRLTPVKDIKISDITDFYNFYKDNSDIATIKKYNLKNATALKKILAINNLAQKPKTESFDKLLERIDFNTISSYYKTHSVAECAEHFNIGNLHKLLLFYNLIKTKPKETFEEVIQRIDKNEFLKLYFAGRYEDLYDTFNLSYTMIRKLKNYFEVENKTASVEAILASLDKESFRADVAKSANTKKELMELYNIPTICCFESLCKRLEINYNPKCSEFELELYNFVKSLTDYKVQQHVRKIDGFDNKEIDIYIPALKLGIEANGTYWHSSLNNLDRSYHFKKSKNAEALGIHLIHIWEYEWEDIQKQKILKTYLQLILNKIPRRIYARNCSIHKISNKEAKDFNLENHLQGHRNAQITYGLFYKDELVQLMSFSRTKYNRNLKTENTWEIIRGCPGSANLVVGGVSKLFTAFVREYNPDSVFSYCDFNKFNGKSYLALGMHFDGYTGPDLKYLMPDRTVVNRNPRKYKQHMSEAEALLYGAGSKKFIWYKKEE